MSNAVPHPSEKRAIVQAIVNALGNCASICASPCHLLYLLYFANSSSPLVSSVDGSFLFPTSSTDHNRTGFAVTMAFMIIAFVMAFLLRYLLAKYPHPSLDTATSQHVAHETRYDEKSGEHGPSAS